MPDPGAHKRTLYPPSSKKGPVDNGDDVIAVKRAISRAGFLKWSDFDGVYGETIADSVAKFQKSVGMDISGFYGDATHTKLKATKVPKGATHAGEDVFDQTAANLYKGYSTGGGGSGKPPAERVQAKLTEFCEKAIAEPDWYYSQNRAIDISVNPNGPTTSDCSGSCIQAFQFAKRETGVNVPDPAQQGWSGYGNTNYYEDDWPTCGAPYKVGDLAHYDGHVCLCYHPGNADTADWFSFGSEPPSKRKLHYRTDFRKVVRPKLVA